MKAESSSGLFVVDVAGTADFEDDNFVVDAEGNVDEFNKSVKTKDSVIEQQAKKKVDFSRLTYGGVEDVCFIFFSYNSQVTLL